MLDDNIKICIVKPRDHQRVTNFVVKHYHGDDRLSTSSENNLTPMTPIDLSMIEECLNSGASIMSYYDTPAGEELLGVMLITIRECSFGEREAHKKKRKRRSRIPCCFKCCVRKKYRGKKIEQRLIVASIRLAKRVGFSLWAADASSFLTAGVAERLPMDRASTVYFKDASNGSSFCVVPLAHTDSKTQVAHL